MPPVLKKRGRPKGHDLTVIGLPAKKCTHAAKPKLQPFLKLHTSLKEKGVVYTCVLYAVTHTVRFNHYSDARMVRGQQGGSYCT